VPIVMLDTNIVSGLIDPDDALHATARGAGADVLLSADRKFRAIAPDLVELVAPQGR
jgi:hypothetical protein